MATRVKTRKKTRIKIRHYIIFLKRRKKVSKSDLIKLFVEFFLKNPYANYKDLSLIIAPYIQDEVKQKKVIDNIRKYLQINRMMKSHKYNGSSGHFYSSKEFNEEQIKKIEKKFDVKIDNDLVVVSERRIDFSQTLETFMWKGETV
jgi:hypothetical protein